MEIKTKFNPGDKFWTLNQNRASQETVLGVEIKITKDKTEVIYHTDDLISIIEGMNHTPPQIWGGSNPVQYREGFFPKRSIFKESECFVSQEALGNYVKIMQPAEK